MITGVYKITAPDGKIYIGQSMDIETRWLGYNRMRYVTFLLKQSFETFGIPNHNFEILEECESKFLNERERYFQELYEACGENGLNGLFTKTAKKPQIVRQSVKDRISATFKSKPNQHFATNQVLVFNNLTGVYYDSINLAAKSLGVNQVTLNNNLTGFTNFNKYPIEFAFEDEIRDAEIEERRILRISKQGPRVRKADHKCTNVLVFNITTGIFYDSVKEAAISCNLQYCALINRLKGRTKNFTNLIYA